VTVEEWVNLVRQCLLNAHDVGALVVSVTCDGPSCNFAITEELAVKIDPPHNIVSSFPHPVDPTMNINFVLDACHMLKLVRNCFSSYGIRYSKMKLVEKLIGSTMNSCTSSRNRKSLG